ncbi:MAG: NIL domain-containing protein [Thermodesulfobacteriota bacterium]
MTTEKVSRNVLLIFNREIMYNPVIYQAAMKFGILFNILEARIWPRQEGRLVLQLEGKEKRLEQAISFLEQEKVRVEVLSERVKRDLERCVHCGACTGVCKTGALDLDRQTMEVVFDPEKCLLCGQCRMACPMAAMSMAAIDMDVLTAR